MFLITFDTTKRTVLTTRLMLHGLTDSRRKWQPLKRAPTPAPLNCRDVCHA